MTTRSGAGAPPEPEPRPAEQELCDVCLSPRALGSDTDTILPCAHGFHQHCIMQWLADHSDCPVCHTAVWEAGAGAGAGTEAMHELRAVADAEYEDEEAEAPAVRSFLSSALL